MISLKHTSLPTTPLHALGPSEHRMILPAGAAQLPDFELKVTIVLREQRRKAFEENLLQDERGQGECTNWVRVC